MGAVTNLFLPKIFIAHFLRRSGMKRLFFAFGIYCLFLSPAFSSPTGTVTMKYLGYSAAPYKTVSFYADADGSYPPYEVSYDSDVIAGYYKHDISTATDAGIYVSDPLMGFCIDLSQSPAANYATFDVVPLTEAPDPTFIGSTITVDKADLLRELWGRHYSTSMTDQQAAEFQLAVWELIFETSGVYDISSGSVKSNHYISGTNALLCGLDGTGPMANLVVLSHPDYQDMLAQVPCPGAVMLCSIGMVMVSWLRVRRRI
jgi:hypothetical protein